MDNMVLSYSSSLEDVSLELVSSGHNQILIVLWFLYCVLWFLVGSFILILKIDQIIDEPGGLELGTPEAANDSGPQE